jgi:hypothetical protein
VPKARTSVAIAWSTSASLAMVATLGGLMFMLDPPWVTRP